MMALALPGERGGVCAGGSGCFLRGRRSHPMLGAGCRWHEMRPKGPQCGFPELGGTDGEPTASWPGLGAPGGGTPTGCHGVGVAGAAQTTASGVAGCCKNSFLGFFSCGKADLKGGWVPPLRAGHRWHTGVRLLSGSGGNRGAPCPLRPPLVHAVLHHREGWQRLGGLRGAGHHVQVDARVWGGGSGCQGGAQGWVWPGLSSETRRGGCHHLGTLCGTPGGTHQVPPDLGWAPLGRQGAMGGVQVQGGSGTGVRGAGGHGAGYKGRWAWGG